MLEEERKRKRKKEREKEETSAVNEERHRMGAMRQREEKALL